MEIQRLGNKLVVNRTLEDEGTVYPNYVWNTPEIDTIEVNYIDCPSAVTSVHKRITSEPVYKKYLNPHTFETEMTYVHTWKWTFCDGYVVDEFDVPVQPV